MATRTDSQSAMLGFMVVFGLLLMLTGAAFLGYEGGTPEGWTLRGVVCSLATFANGLCMIGLAMVFVREPAALTPAEQAAEAGRRG